MINCTLKGLCQRASKGTQSARDARARGFALGPLGMLSNHTASDRRSAGGKSRINLKVKQSVTTRIWVIIVSYWSAVIASL